VLETHPVEGPGALINVLVYDTRREYLEHTCDDVEVGVLVVVGYRYKILHQHIISGGVLETHPVEGPGTLIDVLVHDIRSEYLGHTSDAQADLRQVEIYSDRSYHHTQLKD
jgi:hypothetical protein